MKHIRRSVLLVAATIAQFGAVAVRAEGYNWVPLHNKLARFVNARDYAANRETIHTEDITEADRQKARTDVQNQGINPGDPGYDAAVEAAIEGEWVKNNRILTPAEKVSSADLHHLRYRIKNLAESKYSSNSDPYLKAIRYEPPANPGDPDPTDAWGNRLCKTPSLYSEAGLPHSHAFTRVPMLYGTESYSSDFGWSNNDELVVWEHFQEIYDTAKELKFLLPKYGTSRYHPVRPSPPTPPPACGTSCNPPCPSVPWYVDDQNAVTSGYAASVVCKVIRIHESVFGDETASGQGLKDRLEEALAFDIGAVVKAEDINSMRDMLEQVAGEVYKRDPGGPDGFFEDPTTGECPVTFSNTEVRKIVLPATSHRAEGNWSADYYGNSAVPEDGWGRLWNGHWVLAQHFVEIEEFADAILSNELWVWQEMPMPGQIQKITLAAPVSHTVTTVYDTPGFTEWREVSPVAICTDDFTPPKDPDSDALILSCDTCVDGTCALDTYLNPPACGDLPGIEIFLGTTSTWCGPGAKAYISQGNTTIPHTGRALGGVAGGRLQSYSLDTRICYDQTVPDPKTGIEERFVAILRPTGRIVTFRFDAGTSAGKPVGPDSSNSYRLYASGAYLDLVFPAPNPDDTVIHRYQGQPNGLVGVAYGGDYDAGDKTAIPENGNLAASYRVGTNPWAYPQMLDYVDTAQFRIKFEGTPDVTTISYWNEDESKKCMEILLGYDTDDSGSAPCCGARSLEGGTVLTSAVKKVNMDTGWQVVSEVKFTPNSSNDCAKCGGGSWSMSTPSATPVDVVTKSCIPTPITGTPYCYETVSYRTWVDGVFKITNIQTYHMFAWGKELVKEQNWDPELSGMMVTEYTYYHTVPSTDPNYGKLKEVIPSNPCWERYEYDGEGRKTKAISCFGSAQPGAPESESRVTVYSYEPLLDAGDDGTLAPDSPRMVVEATLGVETSRRYTVILPSETRSIQCQTAGAAWDATDNLITITKKVTSGDFIGKTLSVEQPNGTMSIYSYAINGDTMVTTVDSGVPNAGKTGITSGTRSVTTVNKTGRTLSSSTSDIATGITLSSTVNSDFDDFGRPRLTTYLDGSATQTIYGCCGPETVIDREGNVTTYVYDDAKRIQSETRNGITTIYSYDAFGNTVATTREGTDGSLMPQGLSEYDSAGRLVWSDDIAGNRTTYEYGFDDNENLTTTTTYPDGGVRVETTSKDHRQVSTTGTAVHPVKYEYGVDAVKGEWTRTIRVGDNGEETEYTISYTDMLGRSYLTEYPDGAESRSYYNNIGQLIRQVDPDGGVRLFSYNDKGEQEYSAVDMDLDDVIDFDGTDRITWSVNEIGTATIPGAAGNVRRSLRYQWQTDNQNTPTLVSTSESAIGGHETWSLVDGRVSHSETVYDGLGTRTVTSTAPDGSYTVSVYLNGRLQSVTRYDSQDAQLSSTTYTYDAHGRQETVTDARTGTTTYQYDDADRVVAITTTDPDDGGPQEPQVTLYEYDDRVRRYRSILPDGGEVENDYYLTGELKRTWGTRVYPVEYGYDSQGRRTSMTTWQDFNADSGQAVTTWTYDPQRGWLNRKEYNDGNGTDYTYTPGGKLATRTWARGVTTTYSYDNAGALALVDYSDGTPDVATTYNRRGLRATISDGSGTQTFAYTNGGQMDTATYSAGALDGVVIDNDYDTLARRTSCSATVGGQTACTASYTHDHASRLKTVSDGSNVFTYSYLADSPLVGTITANNGTADVMTTTKSYDKLNRLLSISSDPTADPAVSYAYQYNKANQRTKATLADGSYWVYSYDGLGQVTSGVKYFPDGTAVPGMTFGYNFDDIGNRRTASTAQPEPSIYSANLLNQYTERTVPGVIDVLGTAHADATVTVNEQPVTRKGDFFHTALDVDNAAASVLTDVNVTGVRAGVGGGGEDAVTEETGQRFVPQTPETFTYDDDGNTLTDGRWTYTWNGENRLIVAESATIKLEFAYDHQGRRFSKKTYDLDGQNWVLSEERLFIYDNWNLVCEVVVDNAQLVVDKTHLWGLDLSGSEQGAGGVGGLLCSTAASPSSTRLVAYDGNGNVVALIDASSAEEVAEYQYSPFGQTLIKTGDAADDNLYRFSTKYVDVETGYSYYGHRFYSAELGRWMSRDPIGEKGGLGLSVCVGNDLVDLVDRLGKEPALPEEYYLETESEELRKTIKAFAESQVTIHHRVFLAKTALLATLGFKDFKLLSKDRHATVELTKGMLRCPRSYIISVTQILPRTDDATRLRLFAYTKTEGKRDTFLRNDNPFLQSHNPLVIDKEKYYGAELWLPPKNAAGIDIMHSAAFLYRSILENKKKGGVEFASAFYSFTLGTRKILKVSTPAKIDTVVMERHFGIDLSGTSVSFTYPP